MSFTELLQKEVWEKKLQASGYRVINEPWSDKEPESEEKTEAPNLKPNFFSLGKAKK